MVKLHCQQALMPQRQQQLSQRGQTKMLHKVQKLLSFKISQFKVTTEVIKQSENTEWRQKLPQPVKEKLQRLYKQATEGYKKETPYYGIENDENEVEFWSRHMGFSQQKAKSDYVNFVHDILYYQDPQKCQALEEVEQH